MSVPEAKCLGIDLTQQRPMMAVAEGTKIVKCETLADTPPAALLPIVHGESVIAGAAAHKHRRGTGSVWPPECQAPVYGNYLNGVGRIPLVCAWAKLIKRDGRGFSGSIGDTEIRWRPIGEHDISVPAERLITESTEAWVQKYIEKKTAIIVPDSLCEAAQQALIDNFDFDVFLTPRPVAVALSWCRRNAANYQGEGEKSEEGATIGHLLVITMALDQWEVVPIEIRAKIFNEKVWLVPVRNRTHEVGDIPKVGVGLFTGISIADCNNAGEVWQFAFGSEKASSFADGKRVLAQEQIKALREYMRSGWTDRDRNLFSSWDIWTDLFAASSHMSIDRLKKEIVSLYRKQLQYLNPAAVDQCMGVVIDGACARVRISEKRQFGDIIASAFERHNVEIGDGFEAVRGAAYTSAALGKGLPCYRETIIPIWIYHLRRNMHGDWENAWKILVEGATVKAGSEYGSKTPIEDLKIKQGEKELMLILRRPSSRNDYIFRKVIAEIPEETRQDEPIRISANLQPGQSFAKVAIESAREGIFHTLLNWRTMEPCDPPEKPKLAYLPQVSVVIHDEDFWFKAEPSIHSAIRALRSDAPDLLDRLGQLREHINRWPLADRVDEYRGRIPKGDIFLHYGVFPSDGNLEMVHSPSLAKEFAKECEAYFSRQGRFTETKKSIQQTVSWLYLACPPAIIESVRKKLRRGIASISKVDLHTMGLCFEDPSDIKSFFAALEQLFQLRCSGINEWLRTIRNIVRFRDHALQPEIVSKGRLENIISGLLRSLEGEVRVSNFAQIYNNCILAILYLLKRRRYEPDFMTSGDDHYNQRLDNILSALINKRRNELSNRQSEIVSITLRFLRQEASYADLQGIMIEV